MIFSLGFSPHLSIPVFSQNDGSSCGKAVTSPPAAELCNNNDYKMEKEVMWHEFTATAPVHEVILSPSEILPQAEITKLQLYERECPNLRLLKEVTTQSPELPRMRVEQLVVGEKYKVMIEREPRLEIGNYRMCLTRDEVGGGGGDTGGGGGGGGGGGTGGGGGGATPVNCQPAVNPWVNPTGSSFLNLCPNYSQVNLGLGGENRKVTLQIASKNDATQLNNLYIRLRNMYDVQGLNEPSISFENHNEQKGTWLLGVNFSQGNHFFRIGRYDVNVNYNEFFKITPTGRVGIGSDVPQKMLHITSLRNSATETQNGIRLEDKNSSGTSAVWDMQPINEDGTLKFSTYNGSVKKEVIRFTKEGKVGIGTNNPESKLDVNGDLNVQGNAKFSGDLCLRFIKCVRNEPLYVKNDSNPNLFFFVGVNKINSAGVNYVDIGARRTDLSPQWQNLIINGGGGNVGIGNNNPQSKLHVNGNIELTGELKMPVSSMNALNYFKKNGVNLFFVEGMVGIGTDNPKKQLHIKTIHNSPIGIPDPDPGPGTTATGTAGDALGSHYGIRLEDRDEVALKNSIWDIEPKAGDNKPLYISVVKDDGGKIRVLTLTKTGFVGIGTLTDPQSMLSVNGTITARKLITTPYGWSDFVFEPGYKWLKGKKLKEHLLLNKRLPGFPSAEDVLNKGIEHTEMIAKLLQTIEELKLENIEQYEEIEKLKENLKKLNR